MESLFVLFILFLFILAVGAVIYAIHAKSEVERTKREIESSRNQRIGLENAFQVRMKELEMQETRELAELEARKPRPRLELPSVGEPAHPPL